MARRQAHAVSVISLKAAPGAQAESHSYKQRTPVLELHLGGTQVLVTTSARDHITADDVEFARSLAREAVSFVLTVERMFRGVHGTQANKAA
ncbi:hypothetical protein GCM10018965_066190 [Nonomuraea roseola]